jgi:flagellar hook-associated protein 3 FlgL
MRVTFNTVFRTGVQEINEAAERLAARQREVSSGSRLQVPSDDPSAAAAVVGERAEMAALDQYRQTTDSVESRLTVADTLLSDIIHALTAAQTTAAAGRSTILTPEQRQALAAQVDGIREQILGDLNSRYRGVYLFSGSALTTAPFTKDAAGLVQPYAGNATPQQLDIDRDRSVEVTVDGGAMVGDLFDVLASLRDAILNGDMAQIDAAFQGLDAAFARVTRTQSRVGNLLAELDAHRARLGAMHRASDARRSALEDANLAESISAMQQAETAYRAALGALATTSRLSLMDYLR